MTVTSVPICIVCGDDGELHPPCPICGANVCWFAGCIEDHSITCMVAAFKKSYEVDLPTACNNCGRAAPFDKIADISLQALQLIDRVPDGAQLVGQLCVMFCPAPACLEASRKWQLQVAAGFAAPPASS